MTITEDQLKDTLNTSLPEVTNIALFGINYTINTMDLINALNFTNVTISGGNITFDPSNLIRDNITVSYS